MRLAPTVLVLSAVFGILAGLIGFSPMFFVRRHIRRGNPQVRGNAFLLGVVSIGASLILLSVLLLVVRYVAPELFVVFAVALVVTFLVANTGYAVWENRH